MAPERRKALAQFRIAFAQYAPLSFMAIAVIALADCHFSPFLTRQK
jgi:hypothetical protein